MKIGRNDPCPCGSGKKFKKCHLNREHDQRLTEGEVRGFASKHRIAKSCLFSDVDSANCRGSIIAAHTVSKSGSLRRISRNGKVLHFKPDINALFDTNGKLVAREVGVGVASTFPGFCAHHDKTLFAAFEDKDFQPNVENATLLGFRALAKEVHAKETSKAMVPFLRTTDRGFAPIVQAYTQATVGAYSDGTEAGLRDLYRIKALYDSAIVGKDYSNSHFLIVTFAESPHILFSGSFFPEFDFAGNALQRLTGKDDLDAVAVNAVATPSGGAVVFQWMGESAFNEQFINSMLNLPESTLANAITQFAFETFENLYMAPDWWDGLDEGLKSALQARTMCGTPLRNHTGACLIPDGNAYAHWENPSVVTNIS